MNSNKYPPIIIMGMHRSGTSLVVRILEEAGLFIGKNRDQHDEARFFSRCNSWMLRQSGGGWDNPDLIEYLLCDPETYRVITKCLRLSLRSLRIISYLGVKNYIRFRVLKDLDFPWGWKDPSNTFTLPFWLQLFPDAKVLYVYRNGVDVAHSCANRAKQRVNEVAQSLHEQAGRLVPGVGRLPGLLTAGRCLSLRESFALWEKYTRKADEHIQSLPKHRTFCLGYEDLVENSDSRIQDICDFCELIPTPQSMTNAKKMIDPSRVSAFARNPNLVQFYESVRESSQMQRYSYDGMDPDLHVVGSLT